MGRSLFRRSVGLAAYLLMAGSLVGCGQFSAVPGELDRFDRQELRWRSCEDAKLDGVGAQCAEVTVPLDYSQPSGRTIALTISRVPAADPAQRLGVLLSNPGGPGAPALDFTLRVADMLADGVRDRYDLIGMDPRGVGRSTALHCGWPVGSDTRSAGLDFEGFGNTVALEADLAARCLAEHGDTQPYITTRNTARDIDVIRSILGEERINYIGGSYGTYLGTVFAQMFPGRIDRMVLDSAVDPQRYHVGMIQDEGEPNEAAFDVWAGWAAERDRDYRFGTTAPAVRATITGLIDQAGRQPIRVGDYDVDAHVLPAMLMDGIEGARGYADLAAALRQVADAATGLLIRPNDELEQWLRHWLRTPAGEDEAAQAMILCGDASAPRDPTWYWRNIEASRATQPIFGPLANAPTSCAFWPAPVEPPTVVGNAIPALILQAVGDTRSPYRGGVGLHRALPESRLVTMPDLVAHGVTDKSECAREVVGTYLRSGLLPAADITCQPV
ncbi:alpha/beta hydrolase [Nocardia tengchongensis]